MTEAGQVLKASAVFCEDAHGVRTISLNRPDLLNAVNLPMIEQLEGAIASAQRDDNVRVVLLRGEGRAFCAGDDVNAQAEICDAGERGLRDQLRLLQSISELLTLGDKISVAEVRGWAVGAGFSWALNCDFRLWGAKARAFLPEVGLGTFVTGGATFLLPRLIGPTMAADMLFRGTRLDAGAAEKAGIVQAVHVEADLSRAADSLARELASLPLQAARLMKQSLVSGFALEFRAALELEIEACVATTLDPKTLERMRAAINRK